MPHFLHFSHINSHLFQTLQYNKMKIDTTKIRSRKKIPQLVLPSHQHSHNIDLLSKTYLTQTPSLPHELQRNPEGSLLLRDKQIGLIEEHLKQFTLNKKNAPRILFVVGSSGIGKSMTLQHVMNKSRSIYNVLYLSANVFPNIKEIVSEVNRFGKENREVRDISISEKEEETRMSLWRQKIAIILIQEIEQILNKIRNEDELLHFFSIFQNQSYQGLYKPILIGTSNSVDLPSAIIEKFPIYSESSLKSIIFTPYETEQLAAIIKAKIEHLQKQFKKVIKITGNSITFIANKCSEHRKGDARTVIQFIKKYFAKTLLTHESNQWQVSPAFISKWLNQFFNPHGFILEKLSKKCQIVVTALYSHLKETGSLFVSYEDAKKECRKIYDSLQIKLNGGQFEEALEQLQSYGVIRKLSKKNKSLKNVKISLKTGLMEVESMLEADSILKKFIPSEQK